MLQRIMGALYGRMRDAYYRQRYKYFRVKYDIKSNFGFNGTDIRIYGEGKLRLGNDSYIGSNSTIQIANEARVVIGNKCQISHNVRMYTESDTVDQDFIHGGTRSKKSGDIIIGDGVWVGANVFINPGVTIGSNAVVGANSVVTKDVPEKAIVGGVPAKLIRFKQA